MATETKTTTKRTLFGRLRASPFLSELLSNRLAVVGLAIIIGMVAIGVYARVFLDLNAITHSRLATHPDKAPPGWLGPASLTQFLFGTDAAARDIYKRVLYGAWFAMKFGTITVAASTILGISLGIIAAYYGDVTDNVVMRTMDVFLAFPSLLLALALVAIFGAGLWKVTIALTLVY
ncbi:MAG TPA: ABC transporter permease subunit, partial [Halococcus sp.]|nr:ABC transporter permease subunit [Halococcus sp.]